MSVGLSLLAGHLLADFPFQSDGVAQSKFEDRGVRYYHSFLHCAIAFTILTFLWTDRTAIIATSVFIGVSHFVIDSRRWAEPKDGFEDYPIWVDQALHIAALAVAIQIGGMVGA